jgi:hypothetical protein
MWYDHSEWLSLRPLSTSQAAVHWLSNGSWSTKGCPCKANSVLIALNSTRRALILNFQTLLKTKTIMNSCSKRLQRVCKRPILEQLSRKVHTAPASSYGMLKPSQHPHHLSHPQRNLPKDQYMYETFAAVIIGTSSVLAYMVCFIFPPKNSCTGSCDS